MNKPLIYAFLMAGSLHASVLLNSEPGLDNSLTDATVEVTPHPWWDPSHPNGSDAVWISYADTGYGGSVYQALSIPFPAVTITQRFTSGAGSLRLQVWADNTAWVFLDGVYLINQNAKVGFAPGDFGAFAEEISTGAHRLDFLVFQGEDPGRANTTDNPFGLMYTGFAPDLHRGTPNPTPEPGTLELLLIGGVFALVIFWLNDRKRLRR